jgi:hypothetical protein
MYASNRALSDELFQLSGWPQDCDSGYSLSFLLRKLPDGYGLVKLAADHWIVFEVRTMQPQNGEKAETPEDAAAAVCIKLWTQRVAQPLESDQQL